jgi:hypothetical protein
VDDGASKKRFQLLRYDTANCSFPQLNESTNHPKVEHNEPKCPSIEVDRFPHIKTCLSLSDSRILGTYLHGQQYHSSVEEAEILEQLYRDAQTSQENNYISQFINSDVADIQNNEDSLQLDDLISGWNTEKDHKKTGNYNKQEASGLFSMNSFVSQDYNSENLFDSQPDELLFFNRFLRQNSNPERCYI